MTQEEARQFLQSIAISSVKLQALVSGMDQQEMESLREIDTDLDSLLEYLEHDQEAVAFVASRNLAEAYGTQKNK